MHPVLAIKDQDSHLRAPGALTWNDLALQGPAQVLGALHPPPPPAGPSPVLASHLRDLQGHSAHLHALQDHRPWLQQVQAASGLWDISRVEARRMRVAVPVGTAEVRVGAVGEPRNETGLRPRPGHDWGPKGAVQVPTQCTGVSRGDRAAQVGCMRQVLGPGALGRPRGSG